MPVFEDFEDLVSAFLVIFIIALIITISWLSTYVRNQPIVATAILVFQQERHPNSAATRAETVIYSGSSSESPMETASQEASALQDGISNANTSVSEGSSPLVELETKNKGSTPKTENVLREKAEAQVSNTESIPQNVEVIQAKTPAELTQAITEATELSVSSVQESLPPTEPLTSSMEDSCSASPPLEQKCEEVGSTVEDIPVEHAASAESVEAEAEVQYEQLPRQTIRIKLKFLDDTHRVVRGQLTDEIGNFKRANFNPELSSNRVVRLIFNGHLLSRDSSTLGQCGLFDNCVVHCHISQPQSSSERNDNSNNENDGLDISEILSPLLVIIVAFLWYLRYEYSHIFNTSATFILICLTALLLISQYALTLSFNVSFVYDHGNNTANGRSGTTNSSALQTDNGIEASRVETVESSTNSPTASESQDQDYSRPPSLNSQESESLDNSLRSCGTSRLFTCNNPSVSGDNSSLRMPSNLNSNEIVLNS